MKYTVVHNSEFMINKLKFDIFNTFPHMWKSDLSDMLVTCGKMVEMHEKIINQ